MSLASALPVSGGQGCRVFSPTRRRCPGERWEPCPFRWPGLPCFQPNPPPIALAAFGSESGLFQVSHGVAAEPVLGRPSGPERRETSPWRRPCIRLLVARVAVFPTPNPNRRLRLRELLGDACPSIEWPWVKPSPQSWTGQRRIRVNVAGVGLARRSGGQGCRVFSPTRRRCPGERWEPCPNFGGKRRLPPASPG